MDLAIPTIVTEEAAKWVSGLGMEPEMQRMIEWTRQKVPYLQAIRVIPSYCHYQQFGILLVIQAHCKWCDELANAIPVEWDWAGWKAQMFPPEVGMRFIVSCSFQPLPAEEAPRVA